MSTPTQDLAAAGVSIWLDDLSRQRITTGNLQELIETRNVVGVTTNPTIFQGAISAGVGYEEAIAAQAIAGVMGVTLLLAWSGESFMLSATPIWVRPVAVALSVAQEGLHG